MPSSAHSSRLRRLALSVSQFRACARALQQGHADKEDLVANIQIVMPGEIARAHPTRRRPFA